MFLMIILSILLFVIYAIYFRADGGNYENIIKILKGLNSNTFNYLETNKKLLGLEKDMPQFYFDYGNEESENLSTLQFFSDCVRLNRACQLYNLAEKWPASTKWRTESDEGASAGGWDHLEKLFGDAELEVYGKEKTGLLSIASRVWSFALRHKQPQDFKSFRDSVKKAELSEIAIKESRKEITDSLREDIEVPNFYRQVADLEDVEFFMGAHYVEKPHYEKQEQILCSIVGQLSVVMIPHVNRQEVHAAEMEDSLYWEAEASSAEQINGSPVNFFIPDKVKYPHFNSSTRQKVDLNQADCVFIPAYYYFQL